MRTIELTKQYLLAGLVLISACARLDQVGRRPEMTSPEQGPEYMAMMGGGLPQDNRRPITTQASLWTGDRGSLLGDRRAGLRGDILTVVIEIDDKAEISNSTGRNRSSSEKMGIPSLLGIPQRLQGLLPGGQSYSDAVATSSSSNYKGDGSVARKEKLTLRIAATVTDQLPNGVLRIQGSQEVRVNNEIRELLVSGFVRAEDISRQNEITYDKMAGARISYGGRGQISDVQQPRYGQQAADAVLPF